MNRDDLKQYLELIEREIANGKLTVEKQRLLIKDQVRPVWIVSMKLSRY